MFNVDEVGPEDKVIYILEQGQVSMEKALELKIQKTTRLQDLQKLAKKKFHLKVDNVSFFNDEGLEINQDDLPYIKNFASLYISKSNHTPPSQQYLKAGQYQNGSYFVEYEQIQLLGMGGSSKVYLCKHRRTNNYFAVKMISTQNYVDAEHIDALFGEAQTLKSLRHSNIVNIYNCFALPNMQVVFVMEYLEGGDLADFIEKNGSLEEDRAYSIFKQLLSAAEYCHSQGIIHRDLKLENILLTNSKGERVKIVDFGISGLQNPMNNQLKKPLGSLKYMAPESLLNRKELIGPGVDIWSLGVILYCLVVGSVPFDGHSEEEIAQKILSGKYRIPVTISKELNDLLKKILCLDPRKRYKAYQINEHQWVKQHSNRIDYWHSIKLREKTVSIRSEATYRSKKENSGLINGSNSSIGSQVSPLIDRRDQKGEAKIVSYTQDHSKLVVKLNRTTDLRSRSQFQQISLKQAKNLNIKRLQKKYNDFEFQLQADKSEMLSLKPINERVRKEKRQLHTSVSPGMTARTFYKIGQCQDVFGRQRIIQRREHLLQQFFGGRKRKQNLTLF